MGDVVMLADYRPPQEPVAPTGDAAQACRGFAAGLQRMRAASSLLAEATAELRELAREADPGRHRVK